MWVVLVVAGILLLVSAFAVWVNRVALNTPVFTDTSSSLLDNDEIRSAVATRAVDELFANVDVRAEIENQLPKDFKSLSGIASAAARQAAYQVADRALEQPQFQRLFRAALRESHATLVDVLEGGGPRVSTSGGEVTLDLRELLLETADRIGIGSQVAERLPADAGQIVILRSDQLDTAQNAFQLLKTLAWFLPILTLVAFAGAVLLARDRRRAVRGIGAVLVLVGFVGLIAARLTGNYVVKSLVAEENNRPAASDAWDILTDLMRGSFVLMVVVGVLVLIAAWLAGTGRRAVATRKVLAPALRVRLWPYLVLAALTIILLSTSSASDFARYFVILILVALGITWIEVTRTQTVREFPDATGPEMFSDIREKVTAWWDELRGAAPGLPAPAATSAPTAAPSVASAAPTPAGVDLTARLVSLGELHAKGELTDEEYATAKARVLAGG